MNEKPERKNNQAIDTPFDQEAAFRLEALFPDPKNAFASYNVGTANQDSVIVALDTNILLLPYSIQNTNFPALGDAYRTLARAGRLFLPARSAREFIVHRDRKLADILKALLDMKSKLHIEGPSASPILDGLPGRDGLKEAIEKLSTAKKGYSDSIQKIHDEISGWKGNDQITRMYGEVFTEKNIVEPSESKESMLIEWEARSRQKIPPGYKDSSKDDYGIGDFLIWKSLLRLGEDQKKDLIFVTAEQKPDWYVRSNGSGAYPRPELVEEYRQRSGGKGLRLSSLHEILRDLHVEQTIVEVIEEAEIRSSTVEVRKPASGAGPMHFNIRSGDRPRVAVHQSFELPYGGGDIEIQTAHGAFLFRVSDAKKDKLWLYQGDRAPKIGFVTPGAPGSMIEPSEFVPVVGNFAVEASDYFYVDSGNDVILIAKLVSSTSPEVFGEEMRVTIIWSVPLNKGDPLYRL